MRNYFNVRSASLFLIDHLDTNGSHWTSLFTIVSIWMVEIKREIENIVEDVEAHNERENTRTRHMLKRDKA